MAINTNRITQTIPLEMRSPGYSELLFLRAEINATEHRPFALVRYAIAGRERSRALRLDLGKRRFIDPENAEPGDLEFRKAAFLLAEVISDKVCAEAARSFASASIRF